MMLPPQMFLKKNLNQEVNVNFPVEAISVDLLFVMSHL
jgi:hypothetical protein